MAEIVHLKIVDIPHSGGSVLLPLPDNLLGGQISVALLGFCNQIYVTVYLRKQLLIVRLCRGIKGRLHPLIKVAVAKHRPVKIPLGLPGADFEIFHHMADILALKHVLKLRYRAPRAGVEPLLPKSPCPFHVHPIYRVNFCVY